MRLTFYSLVSTSARAISLGWPVADLQSRGSDRTQSGSPCGSFQRLLPEESQVCAPVAREPKNRFLGRWRRFPTLGMELRRDPPRIGFPGFAWSGARKGQATLAGLDQTLRRQPPVSSSRRSQGPPTKLHRVEGSSIRSRTSCSTMRERERSSTPWSARAMISSTNEQTCARVSGFHSWRRASSFSEMASTMSNRMRRTVLVNARCMLAVGEWDVAKPAGMGGWNTAILAKSTHA